MLAVDEVKELVNSVWGDEYRIAWVLTLVAKDGAAFVAISNVESGISAVPDVRFGIA